MSREAECLHIQNCKSGPLCFQRKKGKEAEGGEGAESVGGGVEHGEEGILGQGISPLAPG